MKSRPVKSLSTILLTLVLSFSACAQKPPKTSPPTPVSPKLSESEIDRIYCRPNVISAMNEIWMLTEDGESTWEASFIVSSSGGIFVEPMDKGLPFAQTVYIFGNTVAIFHVHPRAETSPGDEWPSTPDDNYEHNGLGDTGLADKEKIDIYVVSRVALTRYRPGLGNEKLAVSGDWMDGKECK